MCGIVGKFNFKNKSRVDSDIIRKMCSKIIHRGPDDEGIYVKDNFGFGMRRLSIIDLETGHQPIFSENKKLGIVFNGEIYNYKEIKSELLEKGHKFKTNSDTETILHCFEEYGTDFISKLNGMFAIAIFDFEKRELLLVRDRIGIKPLYYYLDEDKLLFASEIKSILVDNVNKEISYAGVDLYFSLGYIPNPHSIFKKIHKLDPGHYLVVNNDGVKKKKYWDVMFEPDYSRSISSFNEEFQYLFNDSINLRMRSDVPFGAFLSGGIDSSLIVAFMSQNLTNPISTFSLGFSDSKYHDETIFAEIVAKKYNTHHTSFHIDSNSMLTLMDNYIYHFDEPFADYSGFPTFMVSKLAREHVKVVLTGDGGDEIFAGYNRHYAELIGKYLEILPTGIRNKFLIRIIEKAKFNFLPKRIKEHTDFAITKLKMLNYAYPQRYYKSYNHNYFNLEEKRQLLNSSILQNDDFSERVITNNWQDFADFIGNRLYVDMKTKLPEDMLTKVDRMSMANSLEARVPFLDYRIVEFATKIPSNKKLNLFKMKKFLKEFSKDYLPNEITNRHKHGFSSPIDKWFREDLKEFVNDSFNNKANLIDEIINYDYVRSLFKMHKDNKGDFGNKLFTILVFQLWYHKYAR